MIIDPLTELPKKSSQLAGNAKKIKQIEEWLINFKDNHYLQTLFLTGPSGCGKSTSVEVLCRELNVGIVKFDEDELLDNDKSGIQQLADFLRSPSYDLSGNLSILMVTVLPDQAYSDTYEFRDALSSALYNIRTSVIFCLTEINSNWDLNPNRLLSTQFCSQNNIDILKFNPIAPTFLKKALVTAANKMSLQISSTKIKKIAEEANGDLRLAMNILLFDCYEGQNAEVVAGRANQEDGFHMLGRILHAKRVDQNKLKRTELEHDVNEIIRMSKMSGDKIVSFLFEHEPKFVKKLGSLRKVADVFSSIDADSGDWAVMQRLPSEYCAQIAGRTVMWHNWEKENSGWCSLSRPKVDELEKEILRNSEELKTLRQIGDLQFKTLSIHFKPLLKARKWVKNERICYFLSREMEIPWNSGREMIERRIEVEEINNESLPSLHNENSEEDEVIVIEESDDEDSFDEH